MSVTDIMRFIGNTPILELTRIRPFNNCRLLVKLEYFNPTGSHKDRIALYMVKSAIEKYGLKEGDIVVEASSGNTAISVTFIAKRFGLIPIIVVPKATSVNKVRLLKLMGAEVVFGNEDPSSPNYYLKLAEDIAKERGGVFLNQYANPANVRAHYETTAVEIWNQLNGSIDCFVMGVGTGGTITGVGRYLKERKRDVVIVAVTPKGSKLAGGPGIDRIEGLLHKDIAPLLDRSIIDKVIEVPYSEALDMSLRLVRDEGVLGGISSGANIVGALKISKELEPRSTIVTLIVDSIFRYIDLLEQNIMM
ncbi:MAG: cysteine synthase family protein [Ignisphaera sp.]|uniref:Cysteine synthase family protein n=1 Tax=Ignisphaera aggregans TaxID=334771 RepID=A0A7J3MYR0_9CREN